MNKIHKKTAFVTVSLIILFGFTTSASALGTTLCEGTAVTWRATSPNGSLLYDALVEVTYVDSYVLEGRYYINQGAPALEQVLTDQELDQNHLHTLGVITSSLKYFFNPTELNALKTELEGLGGYDFELIDRKMIISNATYYGEVLYDTHYVLVLVNETIGDSNYLYKRIEMIAGNACMGLAQEEVESGDSGDSAISAGASTPGGSFMTLAVAALIGFLIMKRREALNRE